MSDGNPALSLIMSTKGRHKELQKLLRSLERQTCQDFEFIAVEQNETPLVRRVLEQPRRFPVHYLHTPGEQGCSRGRNRGAKHARGEFLLFPDDDCWYPNGFLARGLELLRGMALDALTGRPTNLAGNTISGRYQTTPQWITSGNVWTTQIEWLAFWRREVFHSMGGFDEGIGVGATTPWQSAEGQDLMLRLLETGGRCWYDPALNGHDAGTDPTTADNAAVAKARRYGRGMGFVMRKNKVGFATPSYFLLRAAGGALLALASGRFALAKFHVATAIGRIEGLVGRCFTNLEDTPHLPRDEALHS